MRHVLLCCSLLIACSSPDDERDLGRDGGGGSADGGRSSDDGSSGADDGGARLPTLLAAGRYFTCARLSDGRVKCWGYGGLGQLGRGESGSWGDQPGEMGDALPAVDLGTGRTAIALTAGVEHACALLDDQTIKCWGRNHFGQLGLGDEIHRGDEPGEMGDALPAVDLGGRGALAVSATDEATCALLDDGEVTCWGGYYTQRMHGGDYAVGNAPGEMGEALERMNLGGRSVTAVVAGGSNVCAVIEGGELDCIGSGIYGLLGRGNQSERNFEDAGPVINLGPGRTVSLLAVSRLGFACAVLDQGGLKCWGNNFPGGHLGLEDTEGRGDHPNEMGNALPEVDLGAGRSVTAVSTGEQFACALLDDSSVKCWGRNDDGQLGQGDHIGRGGTEGTMGDALDPIVLGGPASAIATGPAHACAVLGVDVVKCWGANFEGGLGQGDNVERGGMPGDMAALDPIDLD